MEKYRESEEGWKGDKRGDGEREGRSLEARKAERGAEKAKGKRTTKTLYLNALYADLKNKNEKTK